MLPAAGSPTTSACTKVEEQRNLYQKHKQRFDQLVAEFFANQSLVGRTSGQGQNSLSGPDRGTSAAVRSVGLGDLVGNVSSIRSSLVEGGRGWLGNLSLIHI